MARTIDEHWGDRIAELCGALALGLGAAVSGLLVAAALRLPAIPLAGTGGITAFAIGLLIMRRVAAPVSTLPIPAFALPPVALPAIAPTIDEPMILDDVLESPPPESRVVQLFAPGTRVANPAEPFALFEQAQAADATDALHAALDEIRRSLRGR